MASRISLQSTRSLLAEAWDLYRRRGITVMAVMAVTALVTILITVLPVGVVILRHDHFGLQPDLLAQATFNPLLALAAGCLFVVAGLATAWSETAVLAAVVDEELGLGGALREGWRRLWSLGWIMVLASGILFAGFLLFFFPGIVWMVSFLFSGFLLFDADLRGMEALLASRQYVRGHWWYVFLKLVLIGLLSLIVGLVPLLGQLLSFLFTPFFLFFLLAVYRELKRVAPQEDVLRQSSWFWGILALLGWCVPLLGLIGALITLGPQLPDMLSQLKKESGMVVQEVRPIPEVRELPAPRRDTPSGRHPGWVSWNDPPGDTASGLGRLLDIRQVRARADRHELRVEVAMARPLTLFFQSSGHPFQQLVSFYFDTDLDRKTGGRTSGVRGRAGYEYVLRVVLESRPGQEAGAIIASLYRLSARGLQALGRLAPEQVTVPRPHMLTVRVPLSRLGLHGQNRLRLCYREEAGPLGSALARDQLVMIPDREGLPAGKNN